MEKEREISEELENNPVNATETDSLHENELSETQHESEAEEHEEDDHEHHDEHDYHHFTKEQFVDLIEGLSKETDFKKTDKILKEVRHYFDDIKHQERNEALQQFLASGGEEGDFEYRYDELTQRFENSFKQLKEQKAKHFQEIERKREKNLQGKNALLDKLRQLVDSEEDNVSITALKDIQNEWKSIGPIPGQYVKSLWANYNALIDRFYDNRSIYFELKELDRRKNLEAKQEICERAEKLSEENNLKEAIKTLNELHEEYKHLGPVPKENQEDLWQRFKEASDKVYSKRRESAETFKQELQANAAEKRKLGEKVKDFLSFESDRINDWNKKTKELLDLQKEWDKIGSVPREDAKEINRNFWSSFKTFFINKNNFFKRLEEQRDENLSKKEELVKQAEALKNSTDWIHTSNELKRIQNEWKNIGPVPEKQRDQVYKKFKEACDHFFENRRKSQNVQDKEFVENLKKKEEICSKIEQLASESSDDLTTFESFQEQWNAIGFVPKDAMKSIQEKYTKAVDKFISSAKGLEKEDKQNLKLTAHLNKLKSGPNASKKIYQKESIIKKQISQLENDISTWKNNLEFFAASKTADKLRAEFNQKIEQAQGELNLLKEQLKIVSNF